MQRVYIAYYKRIPFSRVKRDDPKFDVYYDIKGPMLYSMLLRRAVEDLSNLGVRPEEIDRVITGCALPAGDNWSMGGRIPIFFAKLPVSIPTISVDMQCASSLEAVKIGYMEIAMGYSEVVIAGGFEHMSRVPMGPQNPYIIRHRELIEEEEYLRLYDMRIGYVMGLTAEKLAEVKKIAREEMDRWALRSHKLAAKAYEEGYFKDELMPVEVVRDGNKIFIDRDLSVRPDTSLEVLSKLPPVFKENGVITAGNSYPPDSAYLGSRDYRFHSYIAVPGFIAQYQCGGRVVFVSRPDYEGYRVFPRQEMDFSSLRPDLYKSPKELREICK
ncbi:MAG: beta-ketoacyl synthase N-terminal-like domain-containing protein [Pyrobaculum sp.]